MARAGMHYSDAARDDTLAKNPGFIIAMAASIVDENGRIINADVIDST